MLNKNCVRNWDNSEMENLSSQQNSKKIIDPMMAVM